MNRPENVFPEYCFVKEINIEKCDLTTSEEVTKWMTGLMNASGGLIFLHCRQPRTDKKRDRWLMDFKYHVTSKWIPSSLYRSLIMPRYRVINERLVMAFFVSKSPTLITFKNNAYYRHAAGIEPITDTDDIHKLFAGREETRVKRKPNSQLRRLLKGRRAFGLNEEIPVDYCESSTMEFKHYCTKENRELLSFSASELTSRLDRDNEMLKNISAFANTEGGSLVIGIEEGGKLPLVKGFRTTENQETEEREVTSHIARKLQACIWNTNKEENHWNIFYHDVMEDAQVTRKFIEICVHPVPGGMFYKAPQLFTVNKEGNMEEFNGFETREATSNYVGIEDRALVPRDRLEKHETGVKKEEEEPVAPEENPVASANRQFGGEVPFSIKGTKIPKSFKQSQSEHKADINTVDVSLRDCCIQDMAKHLMALMPRKAWLPSNRAIHKIKLSGSRYFRKIRRYINKQKWRGIASVITEQGNSNSCDVLVICKQGPSKIVCCFPEDGPSDEEKVMHALRVGRELKAQFLNSPLNTSYLPLTFHFDIKIVQVHQRCPITVL